MLSVQRPSMGSSRPPNQQDMPFGYSFDAAEAGFPFPSPPAHAPGPSLLDENDAKILDNFFDGVSSDQFNGDFFPANADGMDQIGFSWHDIPPTFMGTSSSFGQQPLALTSGPLQYTDMNGHRSTGLSSSENQPATTSADMLAAAILQQSGHNSRSHSMDNQAQLFSIPTQSRSMSTSMMPYNEPHPRPLSVKENEYTQDTLYEMVFGPPANSARQEQNRPAKPVDLKWGSDAGFGTGQGFIPPLGQETVEALEQNKMSSLGCFEPHSSTAASTRPPSPIVTRNPGPQREQSQIFVEEHDSDAAEGETKPRKRRKNKIKSEEDDEENEAASKAPRKRRPKSIAGPPAPAVTQSPPPSKRRKSAVSSTAKPTRENLTEDQKRENHIKSEQKRRTLIKEGFDDLGELVPDLRSGGFSKSAILVMTGDFLEDLINGNRALRARLEEMERQ